MTIKVILEHLLLVVLGTGLSVLVGVPLGMLAYGSPLVRRPILLLSELLQTIPALALLGLLMIVLGAGKLTVVVGLVLYSLLPIVHNTYLGLTGIPPGIKEAAKGMGLSPLDRLFNVELPLALPMIFTGVRIATVTTVGVAVFATAVGGGGLGSVINKAIRAENLRLIILSTSALVAMALVFDFGMGFLEAKLHRGQGKEEKS